MTFADESICLFIDDESFTQAIPMHSKKYDYCNSVNEKKN